MNCRHSGSDPAVDDSEEQGHQEVLGRHLREREEHRGEGQLELVAINDVPLSLVFPLTLRR